MADLSDPAAMLTAGFIVASKLWVVKNKQATLVTTGSADPQTARLYRETIISPEEKAIERGTKLLNRYLETDLSVIETVEATVHELLDVAWESQERAMDETGEIDPKTVC